MTTPNPRIAELVAKLTEASEAYYLSDTVTMSDAEFDVLKDELEALDPGNPFLATVGAPVINSKLEKVKHEIPMGSLKKINNSEDEYKTWLGSVSSVAGTNPTLAVNWKLDGSSIEILYKKGKFYQAISRGDGKIGEDVTASIKNAKGLPKSLKEPVDLSVRAEALFRLEDWNNTLHALGENPRNVATGTVAREDGENSEYLHVVAFNVVGGQKWNTFKQKLSWLQDNGFEVAETVYLPANEVKAHVDATLLKRDNLEYEIDGLVVSLNNVKEQEALGEKDLLPYWARAWKFPARTGFSKLLDVTWDVGTRGTINPVAIIHPVKVGGVTITNVTLHNMDEISRLGIKIGDEIEVARAGDVIPKILKVTNQGSTRKDITCDKCPSCGGKVHLDGPFIHCSNPDHCIGVQYKRIMKWIKKREIMYLGDSALQKLVDAKVITCVKDIYFLTMQSMMAAGVGEGMSKKILEEVQKSMKVMLADLIGSLSIDLLGRSEAQNIIDGGFITLSMWRDMKDADLLKLGGYGPVKAGRILTSLRKNWATIEELAKILEVTEGKIAPKVVVGGKLGGASFCFTGAADRPRKELHKLVDDNGGVVSDSVDSTLNYLVIADPNSTSAKANKARRLGTKLITETEFLAMIGM